MRGVMMCRSKKTPPKNNFTRDFPRSTQGKQPLTRSSRISKKRFLLPDWDIWGQVCGMTKADDYRARIPKRLLAKIKRKAREARRTIPSEIILAIEKHVA
jgi:hypothetical protein